VIVGPDREIRSTGFNGMPRGVADTKERLTNKELKRELMIHAEVNAILNAARIGTSLKGCTMYLCATDDGDEIWGGCPCHRCALDVIQVGITEIVALPFKTGPSRWKDSIELSRKLLAECGVKYREIENV
jgi:dCMP deaminase